MYSLWPAGAMLGRITPKLPHHAPNTVIGILQPTATFPSEHAHARARQMNHVVRTGFAICLSTLFACRTPHTQSPSVAACYRFDQSYFTWVGRPPEGGNVFTGSSSVVSLDAAAHPPAFPDYPPPDARAVHVPTMVVDSFNKARWLGMSFWRPLQADSVELNWINGLYGPVFKLIARGDSLVGRVRFTTDVAGREQKTQAASAMRIACP